MLSCFSPVRLFVMLWTIACQVPLSMGFYRQEYWSGLPFLSPADLPDPGINPCLLRLLHWQGPNPGLPHCRWILYQLRASFIAQLVRICLQCRRPWFHSWVRKTHWRRDRLPTPVFLGFPCGSASKDSTCNVGDLGPILGSGRYLGEGKGYPLQYSGLGESHGLYSSWGRKESELTERLSLSTSLQAEPLGKPKDTGVGSLSLLPGIFLAQESNWGLLHCRQILYQLNYNSTNIFLEVKSWKSVSMALKLSFQQGYSPSEGFGESVSLSFRVLDAACIFWLVALHPSSKCVFLMFSHHRLLDLVCQAYLDMDIFGGQYSAYIVGLWGNE